MKKISHTCALWLGCAALPAGAAPLDVFLTAEPGLAAWHGQFEAGYDIVNKGFDVFNVRKSDAPGGDSKLGDYHGGHLRAGLAVTPRLWVDGALWRRRIDTRAVPIALDTWQLAAQYKVLDAAGYRPALALRLGAWGNQADQVDRDRGVRIGSVQLESARVRDVKDRQYQLDAIATWPIAAGAEISAFAGAGSSEINYGAASATTRVGDCLYQLSFGPSNVVGTCDTAAMNVRFSIPNSAFGIDFGREVAYRSRYYQGGVAARWRSGNWFLRAGYQRLAVRRDGIDELIVGRGATAYKSNNILAADLAYTVYRNAAVFVRGQYMSKQFVGELPMAYNSLTAASFSQRYGIVSVGLNVSF